jgi:phosphate transport system substrate-binding protein
MKNKIWKIFVVVIIIVICIALCITTVYLYNKQNNTEVAEVVILNEPLYTLENYPKVDASTATQPLTTAFIKNFTATENLDGYELNYTKTHQAYEKLINDEVDLIVVTEPSEEELNLAKEAGVELEVIPVVKEGFVFYVNANNNVENLTLEQIQKIYTGEITNWKEVGGEDEKIVAYQRPTNSGSQTGMLSLVMKNLEMMDAPKEYIASSMEEIVNLVSSYDNGRDAIGYSYYYYATTMFATIDSTVASNIRLLGVNGIKPNNQTIQDSTYPLTTQYYIVINKADDENSASRILANQMLSSRGQKVAEEAGYVPVSRTGVTNEVTKKMAEDKIYAINSYKDTYNENSLEVTEVLDGDISYFTINGLKNTKIQNEINEKIKNAAYGFDTAQYVNSYVVGNFSNILSIKIIGSYEDDDKIKTFNIDLSTGEDIPFEKVFVSSANVNSYLADALYEELAWNVAVDYDNEEDYEKSLDMDYRDTSEYEDKFLMLANEYKENKDNLEFTISTQGVQVYNLGNDLLTNVYDSSQSIDYILQLDIDFIDHMDEVAIYKRYLTKESIFENDDIGAKGLLVFSYNNPYKLDYKKRLFYGNLTDNIFVDEYVYGLSDLYNEEIFKGYIDEFSKETKAKYKESVQSNQGALIEISYYIDEDTEDKYYTIIFQSDIALCSKDYFENQAFKVYAETQYKSLLLMEGGIPTVYDLGEDENFDIDWTWTSYYISFDGELLGTDWLEVQEKLNSTNEQLDTTNEIEDI